MPEGPSIYILKEAVQPFKGKKVISAKGNTKKIDIQDIPGKNIVDFKSWGKHFLICFPAYTIRIHFMLFGSYLINEHKNAAPRLSLQFENGEINFYACSVIKISKAPDEVYDWSADVMNEKWDTRNALEKLKNKKDVLICDALLDQSIFSGVGNIIKNEMLFRQKIHPESKVGKIPKNKLKALVEDAVTYSFLFLEWKKEFTLKKHWQAYRQNICPRDHIPFHKNKPGKTSRRSYYCPACQKLYE